MEGAVGGPEGSPAASENKGRAEVTESGGHSDHKAAKFPESLCFFSLAVALS